MWSALMNGSGLHGGGGAGGGYVPSQGWEFVPCSRMDRADRGRGRARNPLRRISSPPTVFSQVCEPPFSASSGGGGEGPQPEIVGGQMWPRSESPQQQQQQTQHARLKKKFDELKKRHIQDKEEWTREKELLLREVADLQGGENRRILLDLKTVLEEVQAEVKREEEKRSELQLQYTRDRCAWELEKAELKCRIAQLEVREGTGLASRGFQSAVGPGSVAPQGTQAQSGETPTLHRAREEQRRLLADTRSTAMDLHYRLEHNERDWLREKAELLQRFDIERKEWETQLKDMQKKIEELYSEVRAKRQGTRLDSDDIVHGLSIPSTSTGSSLLSSSGQSEQNRQASFPDFGLNRNIIGREGRQPTCFQADFNIGGPFSQNELSQPLLVDDLRSKGTWQQDSVDNRRNTVNMIEVAAIFNGTPDCQTSQKNVSCGNENNVQVAPQESNFLAELYYGSDKKKNSTTLNAALKEIARVSEELCSYQDEIRNKSGDKRNQSESLGVSEESEMLFGHENKHLPRDEPPCNLSQIYDDFRALERENWITLSPDNTWQHNTVTESWRTSAADPNSCSDTQTMLSEIDTAAPPIPPRSSSWNLSTPTQTDTELHIPESPTTTVKKCHSPCVLVDRKCNSPSIVRKFEAMLQENEGKVFIDGAVASCPVPANSNCNMACCHNRWSCEGSKISSSKLSSYGTVQKSSSEVSILSAGKDLRSDYNPGVSNLKNPDLQMPPELPVDLYSSSLEKTPASPNLQGSRRNIMLEQKTAEFNRTLFQAEMGRDVKEEDSFTITDASSLSRQVASDILLPRETGVQPYCTDGMSVHPEVISDSRFQNVEVLPRGMRCGVQGHEVRIKQETPSDLSFEQPQVGLRDTTAIISQSPVHQPEFKHKVQTASSPCRKSQHRAATGSLFFEPVSSANNQPGQNVEDSNSMNENPHGAKSQPAAKVFTPIQQLPVENKQRPMTQPEHQAQPRHASVPLSQSDSTRHGPRMMNDHPWKPLTLAAYPRPEGTRSNYGAVERILKNYESAARAQQSQSQLNEMTSRPNLSVREQEYVTELDMLDMDPLPLPPTLRHAQTSNNAQTHTTHAQLSSHTAMGVKEIQLIVQENEESSVCSSSVLKCFSRPAHPANRRLPSRWASRSPTSSSSTLSSPSTTPILPQSCPLQKPTSSFTYTHAFHIETPPHCVYEPEARSFQ